MVTIRNHNVILDGEFTHKLHPKVLYELGKITPENQLKFQSLYSKKESSLKLAFVCLLFFPTTHYAFLGKWQLQVLFWLTLGGGLIWWLVDFVRLKELVKQKNVSYQHQILREVHSICIFKSYKTNKKVEEITVKMA